MLVNWQREIAPTHSVKDFNVHIMLTQNKKYVDLAEICIFSFRFHHPNVRFTLHCDKEMMEYAKSKFLPSLSENQLIMVEIDSSKDLDWQEQKLDIILELSGTNDLMLDADLRWNGSLNIKEEVTFFVEEFEFKSKSPFREIIKKSTIAKTNSSMKNISFFTFGGYELSQLDLLNIRKVLNEYRDVVDSDVVGKLDRDAVGRVIEQFVLSVCSETWSTQVGFVKITDKPLDGGIVESCYFGATGGTF
jgi:hypothetical protein